MKLLHIAPVKSSAFINIADGLSNSTTSLAKAQYDHGMDVGLISSYSYDGFLSTNIYYKSLYDITLINLLINNPFINIVKDFGIPDVVHVHDIYNLKQLFLSFHILNKGVSLYISPRGALSPIALSRSRVKKYIFRMLLNAIVIRRIKGFIALNKGEKKHIQYLYPNKKIIIAHNGVNYNYLLHRLHYENFKNKYKSNLINIGFLGRLDIHIKGLDLLLEAYRQYQSSTNNIKIKLTFIGDHKKKNDFDSEKFIHDFSSKFSDKSKLSLLGPFFGDEKWREISKFDILIQPSRTEGMPLTVLEAMSIGVPCIVSNETNMSEIIKKSQCGWVVDSNVDSLLRIFQKIENIEKIILAKKGLNGMRYVKKYLTWETVSKIKYI